MGCINTQCLQLQTLDIYNLEFLPPPNTHHFSRVEDLKNTLQWVIYTAELITLMYLDILKL